MDEQLTNGAFNTTEGDEPITIESMTKAMNAMKAFTEDQNRKLGEALVQCGLKVIADPTLRDHEIRVAPGIYNAALSYAAKQPHSIYTHTPSLQPESSWLNKWPVSVLD